MATSRLSSRFNFFLLVERRTSPLRCSHHLCRRKASSYTGMEELSEDIDPLSSLTVPGPTEKMIQSFNPAQQSKKRKRQLPPSRYCLLPPNPPLLFSTIPLIVPYQPSSQLPIPPSKILSWPPAPLPTAATLRPVLAPLRTRPIFSPPPPANIHQYARAGPSHPALQAPPPGHAPRPCL